MDAKFEKMFGFNEEDVEEWAESKKGGMKYLKELEAWGQSPSVKAKQAWEKKMMASPEGQALMDAGMGVYNDFGSIHWRADFTKSGDYEEWVKNEDVADLLEDIY
jgi:hypothetical protein